MDANDCKEELAELEAAWTEYRLACYGDQILPTKQYVEVRQAFYSGIHWLNTKDDYPPEDYQACLRHLLRDRMA